MTPCIRAVADCRCDENGHARHAFEVTNRLPADKTRNTLERRDARERLHANPFQWHTATLPDLTMRSPLIPLGGATHRYPFARSQHSSRVASQRPEPNCAAIVRDVHYYNRVSADQNIVTNSNWSKYFRARANIGVVPNNRRSYLERNAPHPEKLMDTEIFAVQFEELAKSRRAVECYHYHLCRRAPARLVRSVEFHKADGFDPAAAAGTRQN